MPLETIAKYLDLSVAIMLITRLMSLRLARLYWLFGLFVAYDVGVSSIAALTPWRQLNLDYRVFWLATRPLDWVFYIAVVYWLLTSIMSNHRGIFTLSRRVLIGAFCLAAVIGVVTTPLEFEASGLAGPINLGFAIERGFSTAALMLLASVLIYLFWFPIEIPRNIAILSSGLLVYFATKTTLLLARDLWSPDSVRAVSTIIMVIYFGCLAYWTAFLSKVGQMATVRLGHSWQPSQQERLMGQLEALNTSLLRSARRAS